MKSFRLILQNQHLSEKCFVCFALKRRNLINLVNNFKFDSSENKRSVTKTKLKNVPNKQVHLNLIYKRCYGSNPNNSKFEILSCFYFFEKVFFYHQQKYLINHSHQCINVLPPFNKHPKQMFTSLESTQNLIHVQLFTKKTLNWKNPRTKRFTHKSAKSFFSSLVKCFWCDQNCFRSPDLLECFLFAKCRPRKVIHAMWKSFLKFQKCFE